MIIQIRFTTLGTWDRMCHNNPQLKENTRRMTDEYMRRNPGIFGYQTTGECVGDFSNAARADFS